MVESLVVYRIVSVSISLFLLAPLDILHSQKYIKRRSLEHYYNNLARMHIFYCLREIY